MFGLSKREKEEALIKKIKKQQIQIEKEKNKYEKSLVKKQEEITKMAKLILKDGKLQKVEDDAPKAQTQEQVKVIDTPASLPPLPEEFTQEIPQQYNYQMPQAPMPPRQEYRQPMQQEYRQPMPQEDEDPMANISKEEYDALVKEAMARQTQVNMPETVNIVMFMSDGQDYTFDVPEHEVEALLNNIAKAIASNSIVQIQNRIISGRHIIQYMYE